MRESSTTTSLRISRNRDLAGKWEGRAQTQQDLARMIESHGTHFAVLDIDVQTGPEGFEDTKDLIAEVIGKEIPQGSLFAYLFRRFGHPNRGSDNYKDLARYNLATPKSDMYLAICPYAGGNTSISFSFCIPAEKIAPIRSWTHRFERDHQAMFHLWLQNDVARPEWFEDFRSQAAQSMSFAVDPQTGTIDDIKLFETMVWAGRRKGPSDQADVAQWYAEQRRIFETAVPRPDPVWRNEDWRQWPEDDPLKAYILPALQTLEDMKRPVGIRDMSIDPWGMIDDLCQEESDGAQPALSAGYPSGALGNEHPQLLADVHRAIIALGGTDTASGLQQTLDLLQAEIGRK